MAGRLPQLKPQELIRALERLGFVIRRQTGSHMIMRHPTTGRVVTIPRHSYDIKRPLLFGILKQAGITPDELHESL